MICQRRKWCHFLGKYHHTIVSDGDWCIYNRTSQPDIILAWFWPAEWIYVGKRKITLAFSIIFNNDFGASFWYPSSKRRGKHRLILHIRVLKLWRRTEPKDQQTSRWQSYVRILRFLYQKYLIVSLALVTRLIYFARKYISIFFSISLKIQVFTKYFNSL